MIDFNCVTLSHGFKLEPQPLMDFYQNLVYYPYYAKTNFDQPN